mmetsp:Transcript_38143/g.105069  ORF Transcript_38143/g.105069 Transcript_38143/m.105069 type:complete len:239 (-) Transcript_38143:874-1590(-)
MEVGDMAANDGLEGGQCAAVGVASSEATGEAKLPNVGGGIFFRRLSPPTGRPFGFGRFNCTCGSACVGAMLATWTTPFPPLLPSSCDCRSGCAVGDSGSNGLCLMSSATSRPPPSFDALPPAAVGLAVGPPLPELEARFSRATSSGFSKQPSSDNPKARKCSRNSRTESCSNASSSTSASTTASPRPDCSGMTVPVRAKGSATSNRSGGSNRSLHKAKGSLNTPFSGSCGGRADDACA